MRRQRGCCRSPFHRLRFSLRTMCLGEGLIFALKELQLSMPEDISFVMFDDVPWSRLTAPPVSVVKQPAFDLGYRGMDILARRLGPRQGRTKMPMQRLVLPTEFVLRGSCSRPRSADRFHASGS